MIALNPESLEAQNALQQLDDRVRVAIEAEIADLREQAQLAESQDQLPDLNRIRAQAEALATRTDLPQSITPQIGELHTEVMRLLGVARMRLGDSQHTTRARRSSWFYEMALNYVNATPPVPTVIDSAGVLGEADKEVPTADFLRLVSRNFLAATATKVDESLGRAKEIKRSNPEEALARLQEAAGWLTDEVWTTDHLEHNQPQLREVRNEIDDVQRLLEKFRAAREKVLQGRDTGREASRRLQLLNEAEQTYPDYPNLEEYREDATEALAAQLAGEVEAKINDARRLSRQEDFESALTTLQGAREAALRDIHTPKPGSPLAMALGKVTEEEKVIADAEQAYNNLGATLDQINAKLGDYRANRDVSILNDARSLLDQVPPGYRDHPKTLEVRSSLAAEQTDAENFDSGNRAYREPRLGKCARLF